MHPASALLAAAIVSVLLLLPFLRDLLAASSGNDQHGGATSTHLFSFSIRAMIDPTLLAGLPASAAAQSSHPWLLDQGVSLLLLLPGYGLEFGFFGLILFLAWRNRSWLDQPRSTALFALAGIVLTSILRSSVIGNNGFGYRAALLPSFFLLLLAADFLAGASWQPFSTAFRKLRHFAVLLLVLGIAGTALRRSPCVSTRHNSNRKATRISEALDKRCLSPGKLKADSSTGQPRFSHPVES